MPGAAGSGLKLPGAAGSGVPGKKVSNKKKSSGGSGSGGGSVRNYGGGGGGSISSNSSGRYSPPAPPPGIPAGGGAIPSIQAFLGGDTGFQQQNRQLNKTFGDFLADIARRKGQLGTEFGLSQKAMGDQKVRDLEGLKEDFASRGLMKSGLYADAVGDYNTEFNTRMSDLQRRQNEALTGLNNESSAFRSQTELQKQAAKEAAIRRRAEQYGV